MKKKDTGLGKGLGALIPSSFDKDDKGFAIPKKESIVENTEILISSIVKNPYQPRKSFDPEALEDLTNSIKLNGVIQPITVRKTDSGYELIAGERRLRASQLAGLKSIPANIISVESNQKMLELALIENIQRYDLNPIEEALAYKQLIDECGLTQEQVAIQVSKERSTVTNLLRILKLPKIAQKAIVENKITLGHAKVLLSVKDEEIFDEILSQTIEDKLSIKQLNTLLSAPPKKKNNSKVAEIQDPFISDVERKLRSEYATDVKIKMKDNDTGSLEIKFYSTDDLNRILAIMDLQND